MGFLPGFLRKYAEDSYLEQAVSDMGLLRMKKGEDERASQGGSPIRSACGRGFSNPRSSSCISCKKVRRQYAPLLRLKRPSFQGPKLLDMFSEQAAALGET